MLVIGIDVKSADRCRSRTVKCGISGIAVKCSAHIKITDIQYNLGKLWAQRLECTCQIKHIGAVGRDIKHREVDRERIDTRQPSYTAHYICFQAVVGRIQHESIHHYGIDRAVDVGIN